MKIPKYVKASMKRCVKHNNIAAEEMKNVETWLDFHGVDVEKLRDGCGISLEELEYGNDVVDELCERIEKEF